MAFASGCGARVLVWWWSCFFSLKLTPSGDDGWQVKAEFGDDIFAEFVGLLTTFSKQVCRW